MLQIKIYKVPKLPIPKQKNIIKKSGQATDYKLNFR
jgi:hypothetical protein